MLPWCEAPGRDTIELRRNSDDTFEQTPLRHICLPALHVDLLPLQQHVLCHNRFRCLTTGGSCSEARSLYVEPHSLPHKRGFLTSLRCFFHICVSCRQKTPENREFLPTRHTDVRATGTHPHNIHTKRVRCAGTRHQGSGIRNQESGIRDQGSDHVQHKNGRWCTNTHHRPFDSAIHTDNEAI